MKNNNQFSESDCEEATVIAVHDDFVIVEFEEKDGCQKCGAKMLCRPDGAGKRNLKMLNTINARVGDRVLVEQIGANQLKLTLIQYGLPLIGFLAGVLIANRFIRHSVLGIPAEIVQMSCGIIVVVLIGFGIYLWSWSKAQSKFNIFRLRRFLNGETD